MANMNRVFLMGNLTREPRLKQTNAGNSVAELGVAINDNYKNRDGELVESACFVDIDVWGRQAESCAEYLDKGSPVMIDGKLKFDSWENDEGQRRSKIRVHAFRVQFLGRPRKKAEAEDGGSEVARSAAEAEPVEAEMPF